MGESTAHWDSLGRGGFVLFFSCAKGCRFGSIWSLEAVLMPLPQKGSFVHEPASPLHVCNRRRESYACTVASTLLLAPARIDGIDGALGSGGGGEDLWCI